MFVCCFVFISCVNLLCVSVLLIGVSGLQVYRLQGFSVSEFLVLSVLQGVIVSGVCVFKTFRFYRVLGFHKTRNSGIQCFGLMDVQIAPD